MPNGVCLAETELLARVKAQKGWMIEGHLYELLTPRYADLNGSNRRLALCYDLYDIFIELMKEKHHLLNFIPHKLDHPVVLCTHQKTEEVKHNIGKFGRFIGPKDLTAEQKELYYELLAVEKDA